MDNAEGYCNFIGFCQARSTFELDGVEICRLHLPAAVVQKIQKEESEVIFSAITFSKAFRRSKGYYKV